MYSSRSPSPTTSTPDLGPDLVERINDINEIDAKISELMKNVMSCINELEKEKPLKKNVEEIGAKFKTNLTKIESELTKQLDYLGNVCVGSEHQGSLFISQQNMELAAHAVNSLHAQLADISNETFQKETFQDDHR